MLLRCRDSWKRRGGYHSAYLLLPYAPLFIVPFMPVPWMALAYAVVALGALLSFANMVGLTSYPRFFLPTALASAAFFGAAQLHWYGLFQAMPVFAMAFILAVSTPPIPPEGFLQKLCLSGWAARSRVLGRTPRCSWTPTSTAWKTWDLFCAPLREGRRHRLGGRATAAPALLGGPGLTTLPGAVGGAVGGLFPPAGVGVAGVAFGAVVGLGLSVGSCGHELIATDVLERKQRVPMKSTMLFAFGFSVALGYHLIRYFSY